MRCYLIILLLALLFAGLSFKHAGAQTWETGVLLGGSNYVGDFAHYPLPEETNLAVGVFLQRNVSEYIALDASFNYGSISGNDQNLSFKEARNLNFRSDIFEFSLQMEYNFFPFAVGMDARQHTPFIFSGVSVFYFNPQASYENEWVDLQPLRTEGQGLEGAPSPYSLVSMAVPLGLGYKFDLGERWILGMKGGFRITFTDYLDDVSGTYYDKEVLRAEYGNLSADLSDRSSEENSLGRHGKQRGNSDLNDHYVFARFIISYRIPDPVCFKF